MKWRDGVVMDASKMINVSAWEKKHSIGMTGRDQLKRPWHDMDLVPWKGVKSKETVITENH